MIQIEEPIVHVKVDGASYMVFHSRITAQDVGDLRRATGLTFADVISSLGEHFDIDLIAAIVFLSRRQHGEPKLSYSLVAANLGYDAKIENGSLEAQPAPEDDSPEA